MNIFNRLVAAIAIAASQCSVATANTNRELGSVQSDRMIRVERVMPAPIEKVWSAWTTSEGFKGSIGADLRIELRPGGPFEIAWAPDAPEGQRGSEGCTVLSYVPGRMLSFSWNTPPNFSNLRAMGPTTIVVMQFTPLCATQTKVTLLHHGWPTEPTEFKDEWDGSFEYFKAAWPKVLEWMQQGLAKESEAAPIDAKQGWVYLLKIARGVAPSELTDEERAKINEHFKYLQQLTREGAVVLAGPCTDFIGPGIVVFQAVDEAAAKAVMEDDPAVKAGVFTATLHPLRLSLQREN